MRSLSVGARHNETDGATIPYGKIICPCSSTTSPSSFALFAGASPCEGRAIWLQPTSDIGSAQGVLATQTSEKLIKRSPRDVPLANFFELTLRFALLRGATLGSFTTPLSRISPSQVMFHCSWYSLRSLKKCLLNTLN